MTLATDAGPVPRSAVDTRLALVAMAVIIALGGVSIYILPVLAGAIVDGYGVTDGFVGYIMAIQLGSIAIVSLSLAPSVHRVPWRPTAFIGIMAVIGGNLLSASASSIEFLIVARCIVGLGEGTLMTLINGIAARTAKPQSTFTILVLTKAAFAIVVFLALPPVVLEHGAKGTFGLVAAVAIVMFPAVFALPSRSAVPSVAPPVTTEPRATGRLGWYAALVLIAWMLFQVGQNGLWTYVERIAVRIKLDLDTITIVMIGSALTGVLAPIVAGFIGRRFGLFLPIIFATLLSAAGSLWFVHVTAAWDYASAAVVMTVALFFAYPYMLGLAADLDPKGRLAAAMPGFHAVGSALGPAAAAAIIGETGNFISVGWFAAGVTLLCAAVIAPAALSIDRAARRKA